MVGAKDINTPLTIVDPLTLHDGSPPVDATEFRRVIGALQYLLLTCPDSAFPVNKRSQFMHCPSQDHWIAAKHLFSYLNHTMFYGLHL